MGKAPLAVSLVKLRAESLTGTGSSSEMAKPTRNGALRRSGRVGKFMVKQLPTSTINWNRNSLLKMGRSTVSKSSIVSTGIEWKESGRMGGRGNRG